MQESGVPNVTGYTCNWAWMQSFNGGCIYISNRNSQGGYNAQGNADTLNINVSRISNQYQDNLNEVRVKSIISNGYIRLY